LRLAAWSSAPNQLACKNGPTKSVGVTREGYRRHYKSQSEPDYDRAIEQASQIGARLGDKTFNAFEFAPVRVHAARESGTTARTGWL
jgi:hypothetical protein